MPDKQLELFVKIVQTIEVKTSGFNCHEVVEDATEAERLIRDFTKTSRKDRLAFLTLLALPERKD